VAKPQPAKRISTRASFVKVTISPFNASYQLKRNGKWLRKKAAVISAYGIII